MWDDELQLQNKLHERYTVYLESHEIAIASFPEKEESLTSSHIRNEQRHQQAISALQAYINDGTKPEDDMESLHAASLFSYRFKRTQTSKHSSQHSQV